MNKKKILSVLVSLGLVITINTAALADPLSDLQKEKEALQRQLGQDSNALQQTEDDLDAIESKIQALDFEIEGLMRDIKENDKAIEKSEADIEQAEEEVDKAQDAIREQEELLAKRMRAIYMSGSQGYLAIILKSNGISDLISRIEIVNKIIQFDKEVVSELEDRKVLLEEKKVALDKENKKLLVIKEKNEKKLAEVNQVKKSQVALRKKLKLQEVLFANKIKERKAAIAKAQKKINELRAAAPKYTPTRGSAQASPANVVVYASNFLGNPYVWGAAGEIFTRQHIEMYEGTDHDLSGMEKYLGMMAFDCSGFVQYVYRHFGIRLTRTTYTQVNEGVYVSRENLQLGDLIFFKSPGGAVNHVGIYVGNNCFIHAPQSGDVIKISPLTRPDYYTARRILR